MGQEVSGTPGVTAGAGQPPAAVKTMTYTEVIDQSPMTPFLWLVLLGCVVAQILDGFDFQSTSFALPLISREFHINHTQAGLISAVTNFGLLLGALIFAPISDRIGRRPVFQWALFLYAFGTFLSALAPNYTFLLVVRFITGIGIAAEFPVVMALLAEYSPKRLRHLFVAAGGIGYSFGWFVCAVVATAIVPRFGWRALYMLGVVPALMIIYVRRYVPESVRFLCMRGRHQEARVIAKKIANDAGFTGVELVPPPSTLDPKASAAKQFSALRPFLAALIVMALFQLANNVQIVGIGTWLPSIFMKQGFNIRASFSFTMIVLATTPIGQICAMWLQDKMPRKWAIFLLCGLGALCFFVAGLSFEFHYPIAATIAAIVAYQFFSGGTVPIIMTLNVELFPTQVRSLAYGLVVAFARIGSISGPLILGVMLTLGTEIHQIIYYFSLPLVVAAVLLVIFIRVDPRQRSLEDVTGH